NLPDRVLARPQPLGDAGSDDRHRGTPRTVTCRERSPPQDRLTQHAEVIGCDDSEPAHGQPVAVHRIAGPTDWRGLVAPVEWKMRSEPDARDARDGSELQSNRIDPLGR